MKVLKDFYTREDTLALAKELIGMELCHAHPDGLTTGLIVETEAYCGITDRGCHAWGDRRTERTEVMYRQGGLAYVYLCYGIHQMFNVVTHREGFPHAILIRALEPLAGLDLMQHRRQTDNREKLCLGPGNVGKAMGFSTQQSGLSLEGDTIWIERPSSYATRDITESPRVGMNFDGPYKTVPWRYRLSGSRFTSRAR